MKKKVIYKVTTKYSIEIETENIDEEKLIEELNKEFERQLKQDKTYYARTVSLEYLKIQIIRYFNELFVFFYYLLYNNFIYVKRKKDKLW